MTQVKRTLTISNKLGLHARAATQLVQLANTFSAEITLLKDGKSASAQSVLGLMMLEGSHQKQVDVICQGDDAEAAMNAIEVLFSQKFNEEE
ncbi:MAG: HPr family phosphocarrier protein [Aestuariibacter sp.]